MTYLATEIVLHLAAAAAIGLVLGWLLWGTGRRRQISVLRAELTSVIEQEKEAHHATKALLESNEAQLNRAVEEASKAENAITELRQQIESERRAAQQAHAALEQMRSEMHKAMQTGHVRVRVKSAGGRRLTP